MIHPTYTLHLAGKSNTGKGAFDYVLEHFGYLTPGVTIFRAGFIRNGTWKTNLFMFEMFGLSALS